MSAENFPPLTAVEINPECFSSSHPFRYLCSSGLIDGIKDELGIVMFRMVSQCGAATLVRCVFNTKKRDEAFRSLQLPVSMLRPSERKVSFDGALLMGLMLSYHSDRSDCGKATRFSVCETDTSEGISAMLPPPMRSFFHLLHEADKEDVLLPRHFTQEVVNTVAQLGKEALKPTRPSPPLPARPVLPERKGALPPVPLPPLPQGCAMSTRCNGLPARCCDDNNEDDGDSSGSYEYDSDYTEDDDDDSTGCTANSPRTAVRKYEQCDKHVVRIVFDVDLMMSHQETIEFEIVKKASGDPSYDRQLLYGGNVTSVKIAALLMRFLRAPQAPYTTKELCHIFIALCWTQLRLATDHCLRCIQDTATVEDFVVVSETAATIGKNGHDYAAKLCHVCRALVRKQVTLCNYKELSATFNKLANTLVSPANSTALLKTNHKTDPQLVAKVQALVDAIRDVANFPATE